MGPIYKGSRMATGWLCPLGNQCGRRKTSREWSQSQNELRSAKKRNLGLEPTPFCLIETTLPFKLLLGRYCFSDFFLSLSQRMNLYTPFSLLCLIYGLFGLLLFNEDVIKKLVQWSLTFSWNVDSILNPLARENLGRLCAMWFVKKCIGSCLKFGVIILFWQTI